MKKRIVLLLILALALSLFVFTACPDGESDVKSMYTVTFDADGGSDVDAIVVKKGETIDIEPKTTLDGYIFKGWFITQSGNPIGFPFTPSGNITLKAVWTKAITAVFESCGGTDFESLDMEEGTYIIESDYLPTREGHVFDGWYTGTAEQKYKNLFNFNYKVSTDLTLYAKWNLPDVRFLYEYKTNHAESYLTVMGGNNAATDIEIPAEFDGLPVLAIGRNAFYQYAQLESVVIPESIEIINESAFEGCTQLEAVTIPSDVERIGERTFADCTSLTEIFLPSTLVSFWKILEGCDSIQKLTIQNINSVSPMGSGNYLSYIFGTATPAGLREVEILGGRSLRYGGFKNSSLITTVVLPESIAVLDGDLFTGCSALTTINLPDAIEGLSEFNVYFSGCDLLDLELVDDCLYYIDNWLVKIDRTKTIVNPDFKDTTVGIAGKAFYEYALLNALFFPDTLKYIGVSAFEECGSLIVVEFGTGELKVREYAFRSTNLTEISPLYIPSNVVSFYYYAFKNYNNVYCEAAQIPDDWLPQSPGSTQLIVWGVVDYGTIDGEYDYYEQSTSITLTKYKASEAEVVVPQTLLSKPVKLGEAAFKSNETITKVTLPEGLTFIPGSLFYDCILLEEVNIPTAVEEIGAYAFYNCKKLSSIELPDGLAKIGMYAFYCPSIPSKLESVYIPLSVLEIGQYAFVSNAYCQVREKPEGWNVSWIHNSRKVYWDVVGLFSNSDYSFIEYSEHVTILEYFGTDSNLIIDTINEKPVTRIDDRAFNQNQTLVTVVLPETLVYIGLAAFSDCSQLESINLPSGVTVLNDFVFQGCALLESLDLTNIRIIRQQALMSCSNLTVFVPKTVEAIGNMAVAHVNIIYCEYLSSEIPAPSAGWESSWNYNSSTEYGSDGVDD